MPQSDCKERKEKHIACQKSKNGDNTESAIRASFKNVINSLKGGFMQVGNRKGKKCAKLTRYGEVNNHNEAIFRSKVKV